MKAVVIREHGGPEVLRVEDVERPTLASGEVLVRVRAVALNHLDLWVRQGIPGAPFHLPMTTGADVSGDIAELGPGVADITVGTPVMVLPGVSCGTCKRCTNDQDQLCSQYGILGETRPGGQAEYLAVPRENVVQKPERLSYEEAASLSLTFLTAWHMLVGRAELLEGETVLVQAAGSGVGSAGIQIAKYFGATVITTAGSAEKLQAARELGADHTINYREEDLVKRVRDITNRRGVDVVLEHVGGETFENSLKCLAWAGRLVTCGATTGINANVNLRHLFFKSQSILGSTMGSKAEYHQLVRLYDEGFFKAVIDRVLPLHEVQAAHEALEKREVFGKVVLKP
jgi:NADPH:quinone reductase-like Zn-dependent oxidoreductase